MKLAASLVFLFALAFPGGAQAHEKKDALDLLAKAQKHLKDVGVDKAVADFQDKAGAFVNGDLYVFAYSFDGVCLANAQNQKLVGKNRLEVEDVNGKKYIADMVAGAKAKGTGSVDYMFVNPETKRIEPKTTFFERVPGKDMFVACGIYRK